MAAASAPSPSDAAATTNRTQDINHEGIVTQVLVCVIHCFNTDQIVWESGFLLKTLLCASN